MKAIGRIGGQLFLFECSRCRAIYVVTTRWISFKLLLYPARVLVPSFIKWRTVADTFAILVGIIAKEEGEIATKSS